MRLLCLLGSTIAILTPVADLSAEGLERRPGQRRPGAGRSAEADWVWNTKIAGVPVDVTLKFDNADDPPSAVDANSIDYGPAVARFTVRRISDEAAALDIQITAGEEKPFSVRQLRVTASPRVKGIHRQFVATSPFHNRTDWSSFIWDLQQNSLAGLGIPFIQGYSRQGTNAFLMGFVDQTRDTRIRHDSTHGRPGDRINTSDFTLTRPAGGWASITGTEYRETVYFSVVGRPYYKVFRDYVAFTDSLNRPRIARVPPASLELLKHWCDPIPPHADYAYWPPDESLLNKTRFVASICYGCVPTFSIDLRNITPKERSIITAWLKFHRAHRDELVLGRFTPLTFDAHFSVSKIVGPSEAFFGLFGELLPGVLDVSAESDKTIYLINGSNQTRLNTRLEGLSGRCEINDLSERWRLGVASSHTRFLPPNCTFTGVPLVPKLQLGNQGRIKPPLNL